jgi:hypothetical protein
VVNHTFRIRNIKFDWEDRNTKIKQLTGKAIPATGRGGPQG